MPYSGEIFEIYLLPEYQGLGFGRRLFNAARQELAAHGSHDFQPAHRAQALQRQGSRDMPTSKGAFS